MKRRTFIKTAGLTTLSACVRGPIGHVLPAQAAESRPPSSRPLLGRRILTFNSVIRTRWPNAECLTQGDFGNLWRRHHPDNAQLDYRFVQRGTGVGCSDANLEIRWFMNRQFRLALLRDCEQSSPETVIDFTRYDRPAHEPQDLGRNWSLLGRINQKQTRPQDQPCTLTALPEDDRTLIRSVIPDLGA